MRYWGLCLLMGVLVLMTGCGFYSAPVMPPDGMLFQNTKAPMDINTDKTELGTKSGTSQSISILGLFAFGDCSIKAASEDGNLQFVNHADYEYLNILGVYQKFTTIVYGN